MWLLRRRKDAFSYFLILCLLFGLILTAINLHQLTEERERTTQEEIKREKYVAWIYADQIETGYLDHVIDIMHQMGYVYSTTQVDDWGLLWSHNYPFIDLEHQMKNLKPYQMVNHFAGSGYITNKASLVQIPLPTIPLAFQIPKDKVAFIKETRKHPEKLWVVKSNSHRGISLKKPNEIELDVTKSNSFVQQFISNPLLINNRMFDIGVYAVMTSVNPLRAYIFTADVLIRFCTKDYHPFDSKDLKKYVVGDDYTPPREIPDFKDIYLKGRFSRLQTLRLYLRKQGKDDTKMWNSIIRTISEVYRLKEPNFIAATSKYKSTRNFFELVRFDFVLDDELKAWLLEVNMSPNLSSAAHSHNKLMYEKVIFNLFTLTGVGGFTRKKTRTATDLEIDVSDEDIQVNPICVSDKCLISCSIECELCHTCLDVDEAEFLKKAYLEHVHKRAYKRVYPASMTLDTAKMLAKDITSLKNLSKANRLMHTWYANKCLQDTSWCS
ncbi:probable tubulin polyglutamylase ttll-15 [Xenia sp. Carnegie-2017]|uniref:probable tubulin polyglutamylase ttll-15 n=1 Tax=Xenia sp. Carnegie-2017 TaxID=2897299 RepID=UPI001F03318D|nr:probable tubulin polyglutamylase ttll-15 [Xenia sp. Carnegie-2017]